MVGGFCRCPGTFAKLSGHHQERSAGTTRRGRMGLSWFGGSSRLPQPAEPQVPEEFTAECPGFLGPLPHRRWGLWRPHGLKAHILLTPGNSRNIMEPYISELYDFWLTFDFDFEAVSGQSPLATRNNEFRLACNHRENDGIRRTDCHGKVKTLSTLELSVGWPAKSHSPAHKLPSSARVVLPRGSGSDPLALQGKSPKSFAGLQEQYVIACLQTSLYKLGASSIRLFWSGNLNSPATGWKPTVTITGTQGNTPAMSWLECGNGSKLSEVMLVWVLALRLLAAYCLQLSIEQRLPQQLAAHQNHPPWQACQNIS